MLKYEKLKKEIQQEVKIKDGLFKYLSFSNACYFTYMFKSINYILTYV